MDKMMRKLVATPAVLAACLLAITPAQAQFGGLLRKVTTMVDVRRARKEAGSGAAFWGA
jgi:hypothetical protein